MGVSFETKAQIVLLFILIVSLFSYFIGTVLPVTDYQRARGITGYSGKTLAENFAPAWRGVGFFDVFGVYFPAATVSGVSLYRSVVIVGCLIGYHGWCEYFRRLERCSKGYTERNPLGYIAHHHFVCRVRLDYWVDLFEVSGFFVPEHHARVLMPKSVIFMPTVGFSYTVLDDASHEA